MEKLKGYNLNDNVYLKLSQSGREYLVDNFYCFLVNTNRKAGIKVTDKQFADAVSKGNKDIDENIKENNGYYKCQFHFLIDHFRNNFKPIAEDCTIYFDSAKLT